MWTYQLPKVTDRVRTGDPRQSSNNEALSLGIIVRERPLPWKCWWGVRSLMKDAGWRMQYVKHAVHTTAQTNQRRTVVCGINTGFGKFAQTLVRKDQLKSWTPFESGEDADAACSQD
ncbi:hypothetical protein MHYP_G00319760 [Metynnis hypsauchen]